MCCFSLFSSCEDNKYLSLFNNLKSISVYDFEHGQSKDIQGYKMFRNRKESRLIAEAFKDEGFSYNEQCDTIILCFIYDDFLSSLRPAFIHAYSSIGELHLDWEDNAYVAFDNDYDYGPNGKKDPTISIVKNHSMNEMNLLYEQYGGHEATGGQDSHFRIVILNGEVQSAENWVYVLDPGYWDYLEYGCNSRGTM